MRGVHRLSALWIMEACSFRATPKGLFQSRGARNWPTIGERAFETEEGRMG